MTIKDPLSHKHRLKVFWAWNPSDDKKAHLHEVRDNQLIPYFNFCKNRKGVRPYYIKTDYYDCSYSTPENYCKDCKGELTRLKRVLMDMIAVEVKME